MLHKQQARGACPRQVCSSICKGAFPTRAISTDKTLQQSERTVSPLLKDIQFMNKVWSTVETEQQFFTILKVR
jgi:hypothetical protein